MHFAVLATVVTLLATLLLVCRYHAVQRSRDAFEPSEATRIAHSKQATKVA